MKLLKKYAKPCGHCNRNNLLPYEYEFTCTSCGYNVIKRKHELSGISKEKINYISRLNYAELKIICICVDVYKMYEGDDYDDTNKVLSELKNGKLKKTIS